jgi:oxalate decarboxylase
MAILRQRVGADDSVQHRSEGCDQQFNPGDIGYVPANLGHYIKNLGSTDLVFLEIFKTDTYQDISLADWLAHTPPALVAAHFNLSLEDIAKFPNSILAVVPI